MVTKKEQKGKNVKNQCDENENKIWKENKQKTEYRQISKLFHLIFSYSSENWGKTFHQPIHNIYFKNSFELINAHSEITFNKLV